MLRQARQAREAWLPSAARGWLQEAVHGRCQLRPQAAAPCSARPSPTGPTLPRMPRLQAARRQQIHSLIAQLEQQSPVQQPTQQLERGDRRGLAGVVLDLALLD